MRAYRAGADEIATSKGEAAFQAGSVFQSDRYDSVLGFEWVASAILKAQAIERLILK